MKRFLVLFSLFFLLVQHAFSQCNDPIYSYPFYQSFIGGNGEDEVIDIAIDENTNNVYMLLLSNSTDITPSNGVMGTPMGSDHSYVFAFDEYSNFLWSVQIADFDDPQAINFNSDGTISMVGLTYNMVLPGGNAVPGHDLIHNGGMDIIILKLNNQGSNLVYQSFFGGSGNDSYWNFGDGTLGLDLKQSKMSISFRKNDNILLVGTSSSTDLPVTSNAVDENVGNMFMCELSTNVIESQVYYLSYYNSEDFNKSAGVVARANGGSAFLLTNGGDAYQQYLSDNAIDDEYEGYFPNPILFVFDDQYNVEYCTNFGAWRMNDNDPLGVQNGTPGTYNHFDFKLRTDACNNLYFYLKGTGFKMPIFDEKYIYPSAQYYPPLDVITSHDPNHIQLTNPMIKLNMVDDTDPFIEIILDYGYQGIAGSYSDFFIDDGGNIHFFSSNDYTLFPQYFNSWDWSTPGFVHHVFSPDLSELTSNNISIPNWEYDHVGLTAKNNAILLYGTDSDLTLLTPTTTWTDENGGVHSTFQSTFGGGMSDGFFTTIKNTCPPESNCCVNSVINFDGVDDYIQLNDPFVIDDDFAISFRFYAGPENGANEDRFMTIGNDISRLEIGVENNGNLWLYDHNAGNPLYISNTNVRDNQWHHLSYVANGSNRYLYLDFEEDFSYISGTTDYGSVLRLGSRVTTDQTSYFTGSLDDFRIFKGTFTGNDICLLAETNDPDKFHSLAWFDFEEGYPGQVNIDTILNQGALANALAYNMTLEGENSNYICDDSDKYSCISFDCSIECHSSTVDLSTGVDFNDGSLLPVSQYDGGWQMISGPDQNITYPRPGYVINAWPSWLDLPGSNYISPFANATFNGSSLTPYLFERCFCVCDLSTEVSINLEASVDNYLIIELVDEDGMLIQELMDHSSFLSLGISNTTHTLDQGNYCLRAGLRNDGSTAMGMAIKAEISGAGLIENGCCSPFTAISGTSFIDKDCNPNSNVDEVLVGIEITLLNLQGVEIATTLTDDFGFYIFHDVEPGMYVVKQSDTTGYNLVAGGIGLLAEIGENEVIGDLDFINCPDTCCQDSQVFNNIFNQGFNITHEGCVVTISSPDFNECSITSINYGNDQFAGFDGPFEFSYTYPENGMYELCLTTNEFFSNGNICNSSAYCTTICVECPDDCESKLSFIPEESFSVGEFNLNRNNVGSAGDVYISDDGTIYASASIYNPVDATDADIVIWKNQVRYNLFDGDSYDQVTQITVEEISGDIYVTGSFKSDSLKIKSVDGSHSITITHNAYYNPLDEAFVAKFDENFTLQWAFSMGSQWRDIVQDIVVWGDDEFVIVGKTRLDVDFDPNPDLEVKTENHNSIKSFVAKYSKNNLGILPTCDWVRTLYTSNDPNWGHSVALGVSRDLDGNIYAVGNFVAVSLDGFSPVLELHASEGNGILNTGLTVGPSAASGYLVKYNQNGDIIFVKNTNLDLSDPLVNSYPQDIEINHNNINTSNDDEIFVMGFDFAGKYDHNGQLIIPATNAIYFDGMDIDEIDIDIFGNVYVAGYVNDIYKNLEILETQGQGLQTPAALDMIFSIYDSNLNYLKSLNPGGDREFHAHSISVSGNDIALGGYFTGDILYPEYPDNYLNPIQRMTPYDFFVGKYECPCETTSQETCCQNISSSIDDAINGDYCCSISISNSFGYSLSHISVELANENDGVFEVGQILVADEFHIGSFSSTSFEIHHTSGQIPNNSTNIIVDFCLNDLGNPSSTQDYIITYFEGSNENNKVACIDTLQADCDRASTISCGAISEISVSCHPDYENIYLVDFEVTNISSTTSMSGIELHSPLGDFHWMPSGQLTPTGAQSILVDLNELPIGMTAVVSVNLYSDQLIHDLEDIDFDISFHNKGQFACYIENISFAITPCCDLCSNFTPVLDETSDCCYILSIDDLCDLGKYTGIQLNPGIGTELVNFEILNNEWELCRAQIGEQCLQPINSFSDPNLHQDIARLCLTNEVSSSVELEISLFNIDNGSQDVLCTETFQSDCGDDCITKGFQDPTLYILGDSRPENIVLGCNMPPLYIDCPNRNNLWISGLFECSSECTSNIKVEMFENEVYISDVVSISQDGLWEVYLNNEIIGPGVYDIVVSGNCDGENSSCTYSFIVPENCFNCSCKDLDNELYKGFDIVVHDGCERGFIPVIADVCDSIVWYVDNKFQDFTMNYEEFIFEFPEGKDKYKICYELYRQDGLKTCSKKFCEKIRIKCEDDDPFINICDRSININGDLVLGPLGLVNDNDKPEVPGWSLVKGEGWVVEDRYGLDTSSRYLQTKMGVDDAITISIGLKDSIEADPDHKALNLRFDARSNVDSLELSLMAYNKSGVYEQKKPFVLSPHFETYNFNLTMDDFEIDSIQLSACCDKDGIVEYLILDLAYLCASTSKFVGLNNSFEDMDIRVYPNPVSSYLNIQFDDFTNYEYHGYIYAIDGSLIRVFNIPKGIKYYHLSVNGMSPQNYMLRIYNEKNHSIWDRKFIKFSN